MLANLVATRISVRCEQLFCERRLVVLLVFGSYFTKRFGERLNCIVVTAAGQQQLLETTAAAAKYRGSELVVNATGVLQLCPGRVCNA